MPDKRTIDYFKQLAPFCVWATNRFYGWRTVIVLVS